MEWKIAFPQFAGHWHFFGLAMIGTGGGYATYPNRKLLYHYHYYYVHSRYRIPIWVAFRCDEAVSMMVFGLEFLERHAIEFSAIRGQSSETRRIE